jgi:DNA polymerase-3 subunit delta
MRRRLFAACQRAGAAYGFPPVTDRRIVREWIVRLARERGHESAPAAADELLERAGADLGTLANEIEKLSLHAGAGTRIEPAHVRAVVGRVRAHGAEELTDRLARHDPAGAVRALRQLLAEGDPPLRILAFLAANLRRALHVAELRESGLGPEEIGRRLAMPSWMVTRNMDRGSAPALTQALARLRDVDRDLKRSRPGAAVFEAAVLEIAATRRSPASSSRRP